MVTDIEEKRWIARLPEAYRPYVYLARLDRPIGVWLLLLPCLWSISLAMVRVQGFLLEMIWLVLLFVLGAILMRAAGCVINDLWDRDLDARVERTRVRPLASGVLSISQALVFLCILLFMGFCVLITMNGVTILLGLLAIPLIIIYPLMKRVTFLPQLMLGLTFNFGALMGWSAVLGDVSFSAFCLYIAAFLWTMGYDTIYAHQDREDDAVIGVKSTALLFGERSKIWVGRFYIGMVVFLGLAMFFAPVNIWSWLGLVLVAWHLYAQVRYWDMGDPQSALAVFKSNRNLGILILIVLFLGRFEVPFGLPNFGGF